MSAPTPKELNSRLPPQSQWSNDFPHAPGEHGFPIIPNSSFDIIESTCGDTFDAQHVESYDGTLGVTRGFVDANERAVGLIHWNSTISDDFTAAIGLPGFDLCTGTLVGPNLLLTAAHCVEPSRINPNFYVFDSAGNRVTTTVAATLMSVDFNRQFEPDGVTPRPIETFAIEELLEYRPGNLDVALFRLRGSPGGRYGWGHLAERIPRISDRLCIVQHPSGLPKQVDAGTLGGTSTNLLMYGDLDTAGGTSGSGVLNRRGDIVGIHILGGCLSDGANDAVRIDRALAESSVLREHTVRRPSSSASSMPSGHIVAVWEDDADANGVSQIRASVADGRGRVVVRAFDVNSRASGQQRNPDVARITDGFVVVWEDDNDENDFYNIHMRAFSDRDGSELFPERTVHVQGAGQQLHPRVASGQGGGFVVVWETDPDQNNFYNLRMRGFDARGFESFAEVQVHENGAGQQLRPAIASADDGSFVIVWQDDVDNNAMYQIRARVFDRSGRPRTTTLPVNNVKNAFQQIEPCVAMSDNGKTFAAAWHDDSDNNGFWNVRMRVLANDGTELQRERQVHSVGAGQQRRPSLVFTSTDGIVLAWEDDSDRNGFTNVLVRGWKRDGSEAFARRLAHVDGAGNQRNPRVTHRREGFAVAIENDIERNGLYHSTVSGFAPDGRIDWSDVDMSR